jgi:hypothetical protein
MPELGHSPRLPRHHMSRQEMNLRQLSRRKEGKGNAEKNVDF